MTTVKFERIVSCSSEDFKYPADNLLKFGAKWKCKTPGEPNATIIIQLCQPVVIESLDIGNEHSAFVQVLVGRAASDEFESILPTSSFMSPAEADQGTNQNRVRMFTKQDFIPEIAKEKWDRIKVICTQPFNKRVQYGLSFIVVKSPEQKPEPVTFGKFKLKRDNGSDESINLGRFQLKKDEDDCSVSVGGLFAKRKELKEADGSSVRNGLTKTSENGNGQHVNEERNVSLERQKNDRVAKQSTKIDVLKPKRDSITKKKNASPSARKTPSDKPEPKTPNNNKLLHGKATGKTPSTKTPTVPDGKPTPSSEKIKRPPSANRNEGTSAKKVKLANKTKPFSKLLEGVTFVISGYENPGRAIMRSKAMDMGAKYKKDWDASCTHLICAFKNTPKFRQVQGHGKIVQKDWIEQCHANRKRLPWRRFSLDINDFKLPESEEEIDEEVPKPSGSSASALSYDSDNEIDTTHACKAESGSDTEEEIEKLQARKATKASSPNPYLSDTEEEDLERPDTSHVPMPPLPT